jgi:flagellar basal-body rod protein FlgG
LLKVINGFYSSAAGMLGQIELQDAISHNLANTNTPGFKRTSVSFSATLEEADRNVLTTAGQRAGCVIPHAFGTTDDRAGVIADTSDPSNLAIDGAGLFVIGSKDAPEYTRTGNFHISEQGILVTQDDVPVIGQNGPIHVSGAEWKVYSDGSIRVDGKVVDKLRIVGTDPNKPGRVLQGRLEGSNVNAVEEMVTMITALRAYEANQKAIQSLDQTLDKVINQTGRPG